MSNGFGQHDITEYEVGSRVEVIGYMSCGIVKGIDKHSYSLYIQMDKATGLDRMYCKAGFGIQTSALNVRPKR